MNLDASYRPEARPSSVVCRSFVGWPFGQIGACSRSRKMLIGPESWLNGR